MGVLVSTLWSRLVGTTEYKIVMVGLHNAGKTTILYKLHLGDVIETQPTIGSNVEQVSHRNIRFQVWRACLTRRRSYSEDRWSDARARPLGAVRAGVGPRRAGAAAQVVGHLFHPHERRHSCRRLDRSRAHANRQDGACGDHGSRGLGQRCAAHPRKQAGCRGGDECRGGEHGARAARQQAARLANTGARPEETCAAQLFNSVSRAPRYCAAPPRRGAARRRAAR